MTELLVQKRPQYGVEPKESLDGGRFFIDDPFTKYHTSILETYTGWRKATASYLKNIDTANHPKAIVQKNSDSLLLQRMKKLKKLLRN